MKLVLAIAAGGAIGAVGRHWMGALALRHLGSAFPFGTLAVNVAGSLAMGILVEVLALRWSASPEMRAFLVVGVLGGFTTFSAFSLEVVSLVGRGAFGNAFLYVGLSLVLTLAAVFAGLHICRALLS
jgi:CrcB protein